MTGLRKLGLRISRGNIIKRDWDLSKGGLDLVKGVLKLVLIDCFSSKEAWYSLRGTRTSHRGLDLRLTMVV